MTMKTPQIVSIIVLFIISLGLSGTVSQAGEIDDLKKRLLFLEAQKEIVSKLDSMQSNIDGLREKVDGFQNVLDDFRVQYDLKASTKEIKNKVKKEVKTIQVSKIYKYNWKALVCNRFNVSLTITADTEKSELILFSHSNSTTYKTRLVGGSAGEKFTFEIGLPHDDTGTHLDFTGNLTPSGGEAELFSGQHGCGGEAKLVPVKN